MSVTYANPPNHSAPAGQYSHVALVEPGRLAFVAGQVAVDADGSLVGAHDAGAQFRQVMSNLRAVLDGIGAAPSDIAELRTFLVGDDSLPAFRHVREQVFQEWFPDGRYPPSTLLIVSGLAGPELKVEVAATVRLDS